jgi:hypothetical protein
MKQENKKHIMVYNFEVRRDRLWALKSKFALEGRTMAQFFRDAVDAELGIAPPEAPVSAPADDTTA